MVGQRVTAIALAMTLTMASDPGRARANPALAIPGGVVVFAAAAVIIVWYASTQTFGVFTRSNGGSWNPITETREWHAAATRRDCDRMRQQFKQEGRRVSVEAFQTRDPQLPWVCIITGPDADPNYRFPNWQERRNP